MSEKKGSAAATALKVVGVLAVLGLLCAGGGVLLLKRGAEGWMEDMASVAPRIQAEGADYGAAHDQAACEVEALARGPGACSDVDVTCSVQAALFLYGCLPAAPAAPGTCEGVPPRTEVVASAEVLAARCVERGYGGRQACAQVLQNGLLRYCDEVRAP